MRGPVVAVAGVPGSGKTTLARRAAAALGWTVVEYDRFETMTRRPPAWVGGWLDRGAPLAEIEAPGLREALERDAARGGVILDGPFGGMLPATAGLVDVTARIDCPLDVALARKLAQVMAAPGGDPAALRGWLAGYLAAYGGVVHRACALLDRQLRDHAAVTVTDVATIDGALADLLRAITEMFPESV